MALKTANTSGNLSGSIWENHIGTTTVSNATVASITAAGLITATFTAPNTTDACTGVWICLSTLQTNGGNIVVTLQDNTVDTTATTFANAATLKRGWNYFRFGTPYTFASTAAGRYRFKVANSVGTSGQLRVVSGSAPAYTATYGAAGTLGTTDDAWVGGLVTDSTVTPVTVTVTGTSNTMGSGTDTAISASSNVSLSLGLALTTGNGGTFKMDTAANATLQIRGTIMPYEGSVIDLRGNTSNKSIITRIKFDNNSAAGQFGFVMPTNHGGDFYVDGATYTTYALVSSGVGTAASPLILDRAVDWDVNDEVVVGTTGSYTQIEKRFIKTRNSSTSFVLSSTVGGAEAAFSHTHTGNHICCITRNCIIEAETSTRGWWGYINAASSYVKNARLNFMSNLSGKGLNGITTGAAVNFDGCAIVGAGGNTRNYITIQNSSSGTITGVISYGTTSTNITNAALGTQSATNIRFVDCFGFGEAGGGSGGCHFSTVSGSANIRFENCWSYGANGSNVATCSAVYLSSSYQTTGDSCGVQGSRLYGITLNNCPATVFTNSHLGNVSANGTSDIFTVTGTYNNGSYFENCNFSATPISNYLNQIEGSEIGFQNYGENTSSHRWYTNKGSFWSSGSGLTDTTTRTAGSLALAIKPENATDGAVMTFKVPANPTSNVLVYGYLYRNATFSSGTLKVDLFLPGTLLTGTPDATVTLATTTGSWLPWVLNAYYSGSVARYATVRITAVTSTAGAYAFLDDLYDAGTGNKVAGLDLWDAGKISPVIAAFDYSSIPEQTRLAVWSDTDTYGTGEKGKLLADIPTANANADALLDREDAIEAGWTMRQVTRIMAAVLGGKVSGATGGAGIETFRSISDGKDRVTATVDANGNRTSITLDKT